MKFRFAPVLLAVTLLLGSCRASGPGTPARTVDQFFNKYQHRPGFKASDWNAGLATRFLLGRLGKLSGGSDIGQALTAVRSAKIITFAPTTNSARNLAVQGLNKEVTDLLVNERYTPLPIADSDPDIPNQMRYSVREQSGKVTEFVAVGQQQATDSFVLVAVAGSFTREQVAQLSKVLPNVVKSEL